MLTETRATLAQMGALATEILEQSGLILFDRRVGWLGVRGAELGMAVLTVVNVAKEVKVMIEEI